MAEAPTVRQAPEMQRRLGLVLALLLVVAPVANACSPTIVWPGDAETGAELIGCPGLDCEPLLDAARAALDRRQPGHPAILRERLGVPACSRDGRGGCTIPGPIGGAGLFTVVLDLDGGAVALVDVQCFVGRFDPVALEWGGRWCSGLP